MSQNLAIHVSASASHYDEESDHYDAFNEENSVAINQLLEQLLKQHQVKTVLDLTCGTGLQVFHLIKHGYEVTGVDINAKMLDIAQKKAKQQNIPVPFLLGDIRTTHAGEFDAVISIFNAIGHLTKSDFKKALGNIRSNLNKGGLYVFDIFNLEYLLYEDNITKLTIDWQKRDGDTLVREIQYSTINESGTLASYDIYHRQKGSEEPEISTAYQTLQVYSVTELKELLEDNGFEVINTCSTDGSELINHETERLLVVARKN
ncbi:MAG: class I SAM-dependent methyltransferase [Gammaproteobacteria bacterium]|nr:class I SAM-dependent methyltransferase [Gammaproteobacteria bacterium]